MDKVQEYSIYLFISEVNLREQEFHKVIRENSSNDNKILADELRKLHPEIMHTSPKGSEMQTKKSVKRRVAIFAPLATVAVVAIVLIPTLLLNVNNTNNNDWGRPKREYNIEEVNCTLEEYNNLNNTSFLYFGWANISDYTLTQYTHSNTKAFLGLSVRLNNVETGDKIECTICIEDNPLDFLKYNISICTNDNTVSNCAVKWAFVNGNSYGIFNWNNYNYYLTLKNDSEARLFELIDIMLLSSK